VESEGEDMTKVELLILIDVRYRLLDLLSHTDNDALRNEIRMVDHTVGILIESNISAGKAEK
jgi:hypothetical protein